MSRAGTYNRPSYGQLRYPSTGLIPNDSFRIEFDIKPRFADFTDIAAANILHIGPFVNTQWGILVDKPLGGADRLRVTLGVFDSILQGGSDRTLTAEATITPGEIAEGQWRRCSIEHDGTKAYLFIEGVLRATSSASGTVPFFQRPLTGDPHLGPSGGGGIKVAGHDNLGNDESPISVARVDIWPSVSLSQARVLRPTDTITVDAAAATLPGDLSGLVVELDPALETYDVAAAVPIAHDHSGLNHHVSQGTGSKQPSYREQDGIPVFRFDGGDTLTNPAVSMAGNTGLTYVALVKLDAAGSFPMIASYDTGTNQFELRYNAGTKKPEGRFGTADLLSPDAVELGRWHVLTLTYDNAANEAKIYVDGQLRNTSAPTTDPAATDDLWIGSRADTLQLTGDLGGFLMFNRRLTANEQAAMEQHYLSRLRGLGFMMGAMGWYRGADPAWGAGGNETVGDLQLDKYQNAGGKLVRMFEHHRLAIPTVGGGVITSVDFTAFDARWDRFHSRGCEFLLMFGYCPDALNGAAGQATPPTSNTVYADYCKRVLDHCIARGYRIRALSFWNEPHSSTFWNGTKAQFTALWLAVATLFNTTYTDPQLKLGGPDEMCELTNLGDTNGSAAYHKAIIDQANTSALPLPAAHLHSYSGDLANLRQEVAYLKAYLDFKGFTAAKVRVSEWNQELTYAGAYSDPDRLGSAESRNRRAFGAAFVHAWIYELLREGRVDMAAWQSLGEFMTTGPERVMGLLSDSNPVKEHPEFSAWRLLLKHGGDLIPVTVSPPTRMRGIASVDTDGRIMVTYSSFRPWRKQDVLRHELVWDNLPPGFTWTQYRIDYETETLDGSITPTAAVNSMQTVATGDQTNLPTSVELTAVGLGGVEVVPT